MISFRGAFLGGLFILGALSACGRKDPVLQDVVARIGDEDISRADLIVLLKELPPRIQARYATQEGLVHLLEETLDKRAQAAEAVKLGLDKDPVVKDKIATYVEQKTAALDQQIQSLKKQREDLSKMAPQEILSAELFDLRTRSYDGPLEEEELKAAYAVWVKERKASQNDFQPAPFEAIRRDLVVELIKKKVREDIRRAAGVTIFTDKLNGP